MARNLDSTMGAGLPAPVVYPIFLVALTFASATRYAWSGVGPLNWNSMEFMGVGSLGQIGAFTEGLDVRADGTSVSLSGIDPTLLGESMTDIRQGAPAKVWFGLWSAGTLVGTPYLMFSGVVDKPTIAAGGDDISISLALESRMVNGQRASNRRYTAADQHLDYPDDTGFNNVEQENDIALLWG